MPRIVLMLCIMFLMNVYAKANPLHKHITLQLNNSNINTILSAIEQQSNVTFSYNPKEINTKVIRSVKVENTPLEIVLNNIFDNGVTFKVKGKFIILYRKIQPVAVGSNTISIPQNTLKNNISTTQKRDSIIVPEKVKKIELCNSGNSSNICHSIITNNTEEMKAKLALLLFALTATQSYAQELTEPEPTVQTETEKQKRINLKKELRAAEKERIINHINTDLGKQSAQATFVYPLGTGGTKSIENSYSFSWNFLVGVNGGASVIEFGGLGNINKYRSSGAQFAGLFNYTGGIAYGTQFAGLFNYSRFGETKTQAAGLFNNAEQSAAQFAGLVNKAEKGNVQMAGLSNIADTSSCQIAGLVNISKKAGVQIGIVNIRDSADGIMVGLVNIARKGGLFELEASAGEFIQSSISFRTGTDRLYAILMLGNSYKDKIITYGGGIGTSFNTKNNKWTVRLEGLSYQLVNRKFKDGNALNLLSQFRPTISYNLDKHWRIFGGPTANILVFDLHDNPLEYRTPSMFEDYGETKGVEGWIGFAAGIRYRF